MVYTYKKNIIQAFRKDILTHAVTWMKPEDIIVSEINQSQEDKMYDCTYMRFWGSQIFRDRKQNGNCQGLGGGEWGVSVYKNRVLVWEETESSGNEWQ